VDEEGRPWRLSGWPVTVDRSDRTDVECGSCGRRIWRSRSTRDFPPWFRRSHAELARRARQRRDCAAKARKLSRRGRSFSPAPAEELALLGRRPPPAPPPHPSKLSPIRRLSGTRRSSGHVPGRPRSPFRPWSAPWMRGVERPSFARRSSSSQSAASRRAHQGYVGPAGSDLRIHRSSAATARCSRC
jgi:hypothetical protein